MGVTVVAYRCLHRLVRSYAAEKVPLVGFAGAANTVVTLNPEKELGRLFRSESNLEAAFAALRTLRSKLSVLQKSEPHTREALARWYGLFQRYQTIDCGDPFSISAAHQDAAFLLYQLRPTDSWLLEEDSSDAIPEGVQHAKAKLNEVGALVRSANIDAADSSAVGRQHLEILRSTVLQHLNIRTDSIEWVYDGLSPLHIPDVLSKRKGIPLIVGIICSSLATMARLPVSLVSTAPPRQRPVTGPAMFSESPAELVGHQAGRTLATAPPPDNWLLRVQPAGDVLLDLGARGMPLLTADECKARYPHADIMAPCGPELILKVWAELARTAVLAHQRRGESDDVAHWLYQLLALDPTAPEWEHMLAEQPLQ